MIELYSFPTAEIFKVEDPILSVSLNAEASAFEVEGITIKFQNLLKESRELITNAFDEKMADKYINQIKGLQSEPSFWRNLPKSVVFYVTPKEVYYYLLSVSISDGVVFNELPYVLPLINNFQYVSYFHLLCLNHDHFKLFVGRGDQIQEVDLPEDAPDDNDKALGEEFSGGQLNVREGGTGGGTSSAGMYHGHNEKSNEVQIDQENYFRIVDKYIYENYTKPTNLPLVLFALPENIADFQKLTKNPNFDETTVEASSAQLVNSEIEKKSSHVVKEIIERRYKALVEKFDETTPKFKLGNQFNDLAMASIQGQIRTLLLEDHFQTTGRLNENGQWIDGPEKNVFINQLVVSVLNTNGEVYVLAEDKMPSETGVAALLRF